MVHLEPSGNTSIGGTVSLCGFNNSSDSGGGGSLVLPGKEVSGSLDF